MFVRTGVAVLVEAAVAMEDAVGMAVGVSVGDRTVVN